ncbi:MAG: nuclear transport factor 2 family protein [Acidimicrobiia bacterium]|nr:nuclear transport factor 2 family protein [Acidimicrobiia bacterium]
MPTDSDRRAITDALHTWCRGADRNRPEDQVAVLSPDARLAFYGDDTWTTGREAVLAWLTEALTHFRATHHYLTNVWIDFDGADVATSEAYVLAWHQFVDDIPDYTLHAEYHDRWARHDGEWLITERRLIVAGTSSRSSGRAMAILDRRPNQR